MSEPLYLAGQGKVYVAQRNATTGAIGAYKWLGNCPDFKVGLSVQTAKHVESWSGSRAQDARLVTERSGTVSITADEWRADTLALAFWGSNITRSGATVTDEVMPTGLAAGDIYFCRNPKISAVTIKDSAGVPVTVDAADYSITDATTGAITIVDPTGYTQPFKISYTYAARNDLSIFTAQPPKVAIRFDGVNNHNGERMIIDLWQVALDPLKDIAPIGKDYITFVMDGELLADASQTWDAQLGKYGRIVVGLS